MSKIGRVDTLSIMRAHNLVPQFILDQLAAGGEHGEFEAVGLFVDVSGFTALTETLMAHGQHGAEVLAIVMRAVFGGMVESVYAYGGFVAYFAGDAFTALFPTAAPDRKAPNAAARALAAAWRIQAELQAQPAHETRFGTFTFTAKAGLAHGSVQWRIFTAESGAQAAYYFRGPAVQGCADAEKCAGPGDIIVAAPLAAQAAGQFAPAAGAYKRLQGLVDPPAPAAWSLDGANQALQARFFPEALLSQQERGEFRQVYNVFISLADEPADAAFAAFMDLFFSLQRRYGGLLNRIDIGDKGCTLLAFWGAPHSYENDAQRLLDFIIELRAKSPIPIRAGLTYRIAHAGFIGADFREEYTCYGRGVNLAVRMMQTAALGEVWLDEALAARLEGYCRYEYLGEKRFKGFERPQPVFSLISRRQAAPPAGRGRRLLARQAELAALTDFVASLAAGQPTGMAHILGDAGVGKTHLIEAFLEQSDILNEAALYTCPADEFRRQGLRPFRIWLREYFEQSPLVGEAANKETFNQILDWLIDDCESEALGRELARVRPFLGALVNLSFPGSLYEEIDPKLRFENTLGALRTLLIGETTRQPVLLLIEDGHWLDDASRLFLTRLQRNLVDLPLGIIITSRESLTWLTEPRLKLPIAAFDIEQTDQFVTAVLGQALPASTLNLLWQRTGGNPYFLEQLLLHLQENDRLNGPDGLMDIAEALPGNVQALLVARLDRLERSVRGAVQTAAVLGREFNRVILAEMRAEQALDDEIEQAALANIWRAKDTVHYAFQQVLMRDAAYNMQLRGQLQRQHAEAAEAYEAVFARDLAPFYDQIAFHFDRADQVVQALPYYERAADQARSTYQNEAALAHYRRALVLAPAAADEVRFRLLSGREAVLGWLGRRPEQQMDLTALAEIAGRLAQPALTADVALRQAAFALVTGAYKPALSHVQTSLAAAKTAGDAPAMARAYHRWGRILWQQGNYAAAQPRLLSALDLAETAAAPALAAACLYDLSVIDYYQDAFDQAQTRLAEAIRRYEAAHDRQGEITCLNLLGLIAKKVGDLDAAQAYYEQSLQSCQALGWRYAEGRNRAHLGSHAYTYGAYEEAARQHEAAVRICQELDDREGEAASLDTLGLIAQAQGRLDEADAYLRQSLTIQAEIANQRGQGYTLTHLGQNLLAQGQPAAAVDYLTQALALRMDAGSAGLQMDTRASLALAQALVGNWAAAIAQLEPVLVYLAAQGTAGIELPATVFWHSYETLARLAEREPAYAAQAVAVLAQAEAYICEAADIIKNPSQRDSFLRQVPEHRQLLAAWAERAGG